MRKPLVDETAMKTLLPLTWIYLLLGIHGLANAAPGDEIYTRPGTLVRADGTRLNLYCMGSGSPAVVFDSGWEDWAPVWMIVQPEVAKWTRACSYDRAGAGFSDPGPMPRTSVRIADELRSALHNGGITGPYILVGHAFGGDNVRTFAQRYTAEVAGLVLVEADVGGPDEHRGDARRVASLRECRDAIAAGKPLPPLPARPGRPTRVCAQQFFRGLPEAMWSPELNAKLLQLAQTKVAMYDAYASEMEQMPEDESYLQEHSHSLGSIPIRVLSTGNHGIHALDQTRPQNAEQQKYQQEVARAQAKWLELSSNAKQLFADKSSEYIPFDQPGFVVDAIRDVIAQERHAQRMLKEPDTSAVSGLGRAPGAAFRDCPDCPDMVVIPAGNFTMGSSSAEKSWAASHGTSAGAVADEAPQQEVSVPSFAMGKYDVTHGEYAAFVRETGHPAGDGCGRDSYQWKKQADMSWQNPGFGQTDRDPVVCVSWQDAQAYIAWLNGKVGQRSSASGDGPYRLPSESEWEYAARAGTRTPFWWGADDAEASDDAWYKDNSGGQTHPVGLKPANAFGLYDMAGNVWQWTEDCYAESYSGAPTDGRANETGVIDPRPNGTSKCMRVDRGAAWMFGTWALRSATRERNPVDYRDTIMGFRVARTLR